ncbi:hypothetical protein NKH18_31385 [Streptomyces sp. M10(2022)]
MTWKCSLSGGGESVDFSKFLILSEDDYSSQDIARDAAKSGNTLCPGERRRASSRGEVSLYAGCKSSKSSKGSPILLETHTGISGALRR